MNRFYHGLFLTSSLILFFCAQNAHASLDILFQAAGQAIALCENQKLEVSELTCERLKDTVSALEKWSQDQKNGYCPSPVLTGDDVNQVALNLTESLQSIEEFDPFHIIEVYSCIEKKKNTWTKECKSHNHKKSSFIQSCTYHQNDKSDELKLGTKSAKIVFSDKCDHIFIQFPDSLFR